MIRVTVIFFREHANNIKCECGGRPYYNGPQGNHCPAWVTLVELYMVMVAMSTEVLRIEEGCA